MATFFILIQRLQAKYRKVTWFAENVVCAEFVDAMKALFPEANCALVNHASFSAERRKRAYFATPEFDLTAGCGSAEGPPECTRSRNPRFFCVFRVSFFILILVLETS